MSMVEVGRVSFDSRSKTLTAGSVTLRVKQGDITKEKADAVVNSTNERMDMSGGMYVIDLNSYTRIECK